MSKVKNLHNFTIGNLKPVEKFDRSKHYVKVIHADKQHKSMRYKKGSNVDVLPFNDNPNASCVEGGLYFTTLEYLPFFCDYGTLVAEIKIPEDAQIVLDPGENKYRANKIEIVKFWKMNDFLEHIGYIEINCVANFDNLKSARGLKSLEKISTTVYFNNLKSAKGLENLKEIEGDVYFNSLEDARGLKSLEKIGRNAYFNKLKSAKGLESLKKIGWNAHFNNLKSAKGLENLKEIGQSVHFQNLKSAEGLESLKKIGWIAYFHKLKNAEGFKSLEKIGWNAHFNSLKSANGLENLKEIRGSVYFNSLEDARGLKNLKRIGWDAYFDKLQYEQIEKLNIEIKGDKIIKNLLTIKSIYSTMYM